MTDALLLTRSERLQRSPVAATDVSRRVAASGCVQVASALSAGARNWHVFALALCLTSIDPAEAVTGPGKDEAAGCELLIAEVR